MKAPEVQPVEKPAVLAVAPKPPRLPPIENAAVLPPARPASLVPATRTAALIAPLPNETTRSRATNGTFTALAPEGDAATHKSAATVAKPAAVKPAAVKPAAQPVAAKPLAKPAEAKSAEAKSAASKAVASKAAAAPQVAQAEPEPEQTEFLGVKVPSLAPAGRKIAESVEAFGNAVKSLPDRF
jgi:hypothetical protein